MPVARTPTVDVYQLAHDRAVIEGSVSLSLLPRLALSLLSTASDLHYSLRGEIDERGRPGASMRLTAALLLPCQRCNGPLDYDLKREADFRFVDSEQTLNALPVEDDDIEVIVGSSHLALWPWVEDEAILSLPLVPRHEACALPDGVPAPPPAAAEAAARPNPFALLATLKRAGPDDS
jgi:uncharacterized protein